MVKDANPTKEFLTVKLKPIDLEVCPLPIIIGYSPMWQVEAYTLNVFYKANWLCKALVAIITYVIGLITFWKSKLSFVLYKIWSCPLMTGEYPSISVGPRFFNMTFKWCTLQHIK